MLPLIALAATHTFQLNGDQFLLDNKPFQIISGEMHPARIPAEYWRHRIRMAKAMGCNTIAAYIFWNYQEPSEGKFDFHNGNHDVARFIKIAQEEGMWVLLRPGPYVCAEWDFGGLPPYLLKYPDIKVRCMDPRYMSAVERYLKHLADEVTPLQVTRGGPILMVQIENEYGSYGNDRNYIARLKQIWEGDGIDVPFYTADGPTTYMLEAGSLPGCAVGLDSGGSLADWTLANRINPNVPAFSSETYPGWLTHWGEKWARSSIKNISGQVKFLLDNHKSFNLYVVHGGTNFGFSAGANAGGSGYEPDVTSYDYDAPITEQGRPTPKYLALRELIGRYTTATLPAIPEPIPAISVPEFRLAPFSSVWDNLPQPIHQVQPKPFEAMGQDHGFAIYRTHLIGHKSGRLTITDLHDYATVFVDGKYIGDLDRRAGRTSIDINPPAPGGSERVATGRLGPRNLFRSPLPSHLSHLSYPSYLSHKFNNPNNNPSPPTLDILVEGMGRINFAQQLIDRKGITDRVTLNGMTLMNWDVFKLPMNEDWIGGLRIREPLSPVVRQGRAVGVRGRAEGAVSPGLFFKGSFELKEPADTYLDTSGLKKGIVWVNGHNLGRYWEIGPQTRLYCPAPWLKSGQNEVVVFDLLATEPTTMQGFPALNTE